MKIAGLAFFVSVTLLFFVPANAELTSDEILKAIVKIHATIPADARTARILGTEREGHGIVIDPKGHILTIGYLIIEAETIRVFKHDGRIVDASYIGYDHSTGFGILRANSPLDVTPMDMGHSSIIEVGEPLLVAGHGGSQAVQGVQVVSRQEFAGYWEYLLEEALFTFPPYNNYGGAALIGRGGKLIGVGSLYTQAVAPNIGTVPCNMFVPIDAIKPILSDIIDTGRSKKPPLPWLGIYAQEAHGRVVIIRVVSQGPAEKAGIQPGDIVLKVKEKTVKGLADFYRKVWALGEAGTDVPLSVLHETQIRDITIHSSDRYQYLKINPKEL